MYLLKAKKRVAQGPSPIPAEHDRILPPNSERYKNRQPQIDTNGKLPGIVKHCKYIGTFKVRNGLSSEARASAIKQHLAPLMAEYKSKSRKDYKLVALQMLDQGVKVLNKEVNCVLMAHALSRISYSVAEPKDGLLAFAAKDPEGVNSQTYCHAFIFDNPKEASEINTTLGNAFRLAYCKRTLKRRTKCDTTSQHTNSSSSTGTSDSAAILRKRSNVCQNTPRQQQPNGNCQRNKITTCNGGNHGNHGNNHHGNATPLGNGNHGLRLEGLKSGEQLSRNSAKSPAFSNHDRYQADIKHLQDLDPESRIKDWLHDVSPVNINTEQDASPIYPDQVGKGRCQRSGSCVPVSTAVVQQEQLRRPSRICEDQMTIPQELKEQEWFQAGIPRHIALECLSMECEGAFIVRNSQTHKGCYALSLRGPGRGSSGTYHYLISQNTDGYYFQGGGRVFPDLSSLIHHHCYEKEGLICKLSMNRNNPLYGDEPDSSDFDEEDPDYDEPPNAGFTTLLPAHQ
ncbi:uncharacterized protein LOC134813850 [Bolinopsis microptera]|uniref:uncharacterized protein LOC134813850 n=1 Tax=Bolinopsis microptera TaxID=2820187 RepID=UPI00307AC0A2